MDLFDLLFSLLAILAVVAVGTAAAFAYAVATGDRQSRIATHEWLDAWFERLLDEAALYFELVDLGVNDRASWHEYHGYSLVRDWLTWQLWKHQRGRYLMRERLFRVLDRLAAKHAPIA